MNLPRSAFRAFEDCIESQNPLLGCFRHIVVLAMIALFSIRVSSGERSLSKHEFTAICNTKFVVLLARAL